jgi:hypothetical protein
MFLLQIPLGPISIAVIYSSTRKPYTSYLQLDIPAPDACSPIPVAGYPAPDA